MQTPRQKTLELLKNIIAAQMDKWIARVQTWNGRFYIDIMPPNGCNFITIEADTVEEVETKLLKFEAENPSLTTSQALLFHLDAGEGPQFNDILFARKELLS